MWSRDLSTPPPPDPPELLPGPDGALPAGERRDGVVKGCGGGGDRRGVRWEKRERSGWKDQKGWGGGVLGSGEKWRQGVRKHNKCVI